MSERRKIGNQLSPLEFLTCFIFACFHARRSIAFVHFTLLESILLSKQPKNPCFLRVFVAVRTLHVIERDFRKLTRKILSSNLCVTCFAISMKIRWIFSIFGRFVFDFIKKGISIKFQSTEQTNQSISTWSHRWKMVEAEIKQTQTIARRWRISARLCLIKWLCDQFNFKWILV